MLARRNWPRAVKTSPMNMSKKPATHTAGPEVSGNLRLCHAPRCATFQNDAMLRLAPNGTILWTNVAFLRMLGFDVDRSAPSSVFDLVFADDAGTVSEFISGAGATDGPDPTLRFHHGKGGLRWLVCSIMDDGHPAGLLARVQDRSSERYDQTRIDASEAITGIGSWEIDLATLEARWSARTHDIHQTDPSVFSPSIERGLAFVLPEHRPEAMAHYADLIQSGTPIGFETRIETANGRIRWVRVDGRASRSVEGPPRLFGTVEDITDERAQRQLLNRLVAVAQTTEQGILVVNTKMEIVWVNEGFTSLTGFTPRDCLGRHPGKLLGNRLTNPETVARINAAIVAKESLNTTVLNRRKDGSGIWFDLSIVPLFDENRNWAGYFSIQRDITERLAAEESIRNARAEAEAAKAQLLTAVDALPDGFVLFDADDKLVMCNDRFRSIHAPSRALITPGVAFETLVRHGMENNQYAIPQGRHEAWLTERMATHNAAEGRMEQQLSDGRWLRIIEHKTPEGGRVGLQIDVTELKQQGEKLRRAYDELLATSTERDTARQRFEDVAAVSQDWFWEVDEQGHIGYLSSGIELAKGQPPAGFLGKTLRTLAGSDATGNWEWIERAISKQVPINDFVFMINESAGDPRWIRLSGAAFHDESGNFLGFRGVGSDVSALYSAMVRAEEESTAKSEFLATMSHEIRTPLNGVLGLAQELGLRIQKPENRELIDAIRGSGEILLSVINDILDFSKIEAGKLNLEETSFSMSDLGRNIQAAHGLKAEQKALELKVEVEDSAAQTRLGDPHRIMQIMHNLVSNALKFTDKGSVRVMIHSEQGDDVVIEVADTGIGMSRDQAELIFDTFTQADRSTTRKFGGTGLGMAITRKLAEAMGGTIDLRSVKGKGTAIAVRLPLPLAKDHRDDDRTVKGPGAVTQTDKLTAYDACAGLRLLVADDNATNRLLLSLMLKRLKCDATIVEGGQEAVDATRTGEFDALLLDISMPGMDGTQALAAIHAHQREMNAPLTPGLAVTANAMAHQVTAYLAQGFADHVAKPINRDDLVSKLCAHARGRTDQP